jgi:hypothetical protein
MEQGGEVGDGQCMGSIVIVFARFARGSSARLLTAALVALLMLKTGVAPTFYVGAAEACPEFGEQDGSESDEPEGSPHFFQYCASRTVAPRSESCAIQRLTVPPAALRPRSPTEIAIPVELARRNGVGAPLRC